MHNHVPRLCECVILFLSSWLVIEWTGLWQEGPGENCIDICSPSDVCMSRREYYPRLLLSDSHWCYEQRNSHCCAFQIMTFAGATAYFLTTNFYSPCLSAVAMDNKYSYCILQCCYEKSNVLLHPALLPWTVTFCASAWTSCEQYVLANAVLLN